MSWPTNYKIDMKCCLFAGNSSLSPKLQALIKLDPLMRKLFNVDYKKKLQRQKFKKTLKAS